MMTLVLVAAFVVLMVLAIPVGHALVIAGAIAILWNGMVPLMVVGQQMFDQTQSFPMLALPFFMLSGTLMMGGRLGRELLDFASEGMKRYRGGELSTTVVASVAFGGVSGSAVANASALGSILIPWQKQRGYPAGLCAANNATSAVIDILIPPSIPMILYALVSGASVADLFVAGIVPGLIMALGFIATCWWISRRRNYPVSRDPSDPVAFLRLALRSSPAIALPILIILGLRFGFATPTEMAVLSVIYSLILSLVLYRDLSWARFRESMIDAGVATGVVMLVIMGSAVVGWLLTFGQVPTQVAQWVAANIESKWVVLLVLNVLMLIVGMPLDLPPAILLLGPIFVPLAVSLGIDPVQLGLIMIINLGIGLYTPPIGTTLFISSSIARTSLADTTRELWPFFAVAMAVLLAVTYIPALTIYWRARRRPPRGRLRPGPVRPIFARVEERPAFGYARSMISQKMKYALKALMVLADEKAGQGRALRIEEIATKSGTPKRFLEQILLELRNAGVLSSIRGRSGGYLLEKVPEDVPLSELLRLIDGPMAPLPCLSRRSYARCDDCTDEESCRIRRVFAELFWSYLVLIESLTLADLTRSPGVAAQVIAA